MLLLRFEACSGRKRFPVAPLHMKNWILEQLRRRYNWSHFTLQYLILPATTSRLSNGYLSHNFHLLWTKWDSVAGRCDPAAEEFWWNVKTVIGCTVITRGKKWHISRETLEQWQASSDILTFLLFSTQVLTLYLLQKEVWRVDLCFYALAHSWKAPVSFVMSVLPSDFPGMSARLSLDEFS